MKRTLLRVGFWLGVGMFLTMAAAQPGGRPGSVSVSATGTVYGSPDRAGFDAGVSVLAEDVGQATARVSERVSSLLAALSAAGVAETDLRTVGFNIFPEQLYDDRGRPTRLRYRVVTTVRVTVRDPKQLGALLGASVEAGANEVANVAYTVADPGALERAARARAMRAARLKAEQLAQLGGAELGSLRAVREGAFTDGGGPSPLLRSESLAAADGAGVPVAGGQLEVTVAVEVVYGLE